MYKLHYLGEVFKGIVLKLTYYKTPSFNVCIVQTFKGGMKLSSFSRDTADAVCFRDNGFTSQIRAVVFM